MTKILLRLLPRREALNPSWLSFSSAGQRALIGSGNFDVQM